MSTHDARIDAYIDKSADFAKPILTHLRELIHTVCPDVVETWKWSFPNFEYKGKLMLSMAAFKQHCSFTFWYAANMADTENILTLTAKNEMGGIGKISDVKDLPKDSVLKKYIKEAMKLNEAGVKRATIKTTEAEKKALKTPADFAAALKNNKEAATVFKNFTYAKKKEYIDWLEDAKTETTRTKRMVQAVEWIAEGKSRHWKYQNC